MSEDEVIEIIRQGEGQTIEFKERFTEAKDIAKEMVAFANCNDGRILFGVNNKGEVVGVECDTKKEEWLLTIGNNNCLPHIIPIIEKVKINSRVVVMMIILEGTDKPYKANNVCYIKAGLTSRPADRTEEIRLMQEARHIIFERLPAEDGMFEDLDRGKIEDYFLHRAPDVLNEGDQHLKEIMRNLEFLVEKDGRLVPTYAGVLVFGKFPQRFLIQSSIKCACFKGEDVTAFISDRALLEGTIKDLISQAEQFVKRNMKIARVIEEWGKEDVPEYPIEAVREAIANAVAHRDYSIYGQEIMLMMFEDRLEVASPGGLAGGLKKEDLGTKRYSRNPTITKYLYEMHLVEGLGTGIKRIRELMRRLGVKEPQFEIEKDSFKTILFPRRVDYKSVPVKDERQAKIIEYLKRYGKITNKEYRDLFKVSNKTAYQEICKMIESNMLQRHGTGRSVYYTLKGND